MSQIDVKPGPDSDCGWWPPGAGEPGSDWTFEPACLRLSYEGPGESLDVHVMTPHGPRALAAIPVAAIAEILAGHPQDEADAANDEGEAVYEAVLHHLVGLVGSEIEVQVGLVAAPSPLATLTGTLWAAADIEWRGDAVLFFAVGDIVNGFYIGREQFVRADAHASHSEDGTLELVDADGGTLRIRYKALDQE